MVCHGEDGLGGVIVKGEIYWQTGEGFGGC